MTTLIAVYKSSGDGGTVCVGRCDAKCYNAKEPGCTCVCGGRNHGAGLEKATDNTREMAEEWLERYSRERQLEDWWGDVPALDPVQLPLF
jgi:hypothetical protein